MANPSYLSTFPGVGNLKTVEDVGRFLAGFCQQVQQQVNNLVGIKAIFGAVGISGAITAGNSYGFTLNSFSASFVRTGTYYLQWTVPFYSRPAVTACGESTVTFCTLGGVTNTGVTVYNYNVSGAGSLQNAAFSFIAMGPR